MLETDVRGWELFISSCTFASQLNVCVFSWFCCCLSGRIWVRNTLNSCRVSFWGWNSQASRSVRYKALTALTFWLISDLYNVANKALMDTEGRYLNKIVFCQHFFPYDLLERNELFSFTFQNDNLVWKEIQHECGR